MSISKLLFGEIALKKKLVTKEQVEECLEIQRKLKEMGIVKTLGAVMHDKKYLSMVEIKQILREMTGTKDWNAIEGYEILDKLGAGGMGNVYKARHTRLGKLVAIKVLPPELAADPEYLDRFNREARAAAKLNHPNIVQALDVGESYGYHYFVMEFVDGETVRAMIEREGCLSEAKSLEILIQVCEALIHAWKNDMIHRDIKPSNIICTLNGVGKLCDLGLAKSVTEDSAITQTGVVMGTPFYLSPEQARSEDLDIRSDIYSLGVTFFHMVTGQVPFTGNSAATILYKHIFLEPPKPKTLNPAVTSETSQLVTRMMAKSRDDRPQDPQTLRDEMKAILDDIRAKTPERAQTNYAAQNLVTAKIPKAEQETIDQPGLALAGGVETAGGVASSLGSSPGLLKPDLSKTSTQPTLGTPAFEDAPATRSPARGTPAVRAPEGMPVSAAAAAAKRAEAALAPALPVPLWHRLVPAGIAAALLVVLGLLYQTARPAKEASVAHTAAAEEFVGRIVNDALTGVPEPVASALARARELRAVEKLAEAVSAYDDAIHAVGDPDAPAASVIRREQEALIASILIRYEQLAAKKAELLRERRADAADEITKQLEALKLTYCHSVIEAERLRVGKRLAEHTRRSPEPGDGRETPIPPGPPPPP